MVLSGGWRASCGSGLGSEFCEGTGESSLRVRRARQSSGESAGGASVFSYNIFFISSEAIS
jgi:hypothetical protein